MVATALAKALVALWRGPSTLPGLKEELAKAGEAQQQEFLATQQELWATQKAGDRGLI